MLICTIIARNYLAHARVLARSFLDHHPGGAVAVLVLDWLEDDFEEGADEPFEILTLDDIGLDPRDLHSMEAIYSVMELATAVKPWLLKTLLETHDTVTYLDPDIEIFTSLDDIPALAVEHGIVLTPHVLEPLPRDELEPSETTILRAGMFNLGFIAVGAKAIPFLDWWSERLARECIVAPEMGRFVDQRWVDFVPALFDHTVLRDPGVNVAWWNLSNRTVRWNDQWEVDGVPIRFFHFSGYSPENPELITKHAGDIPRLRLKDQPDLARLCREYANNLAREGYSAWAEKPYRLAVAANGVEIDRSVRSRYRSALKSAEERGTTLPPDPFDPADAKAFAHWFGGRSANGESSFGVNVVGYFQTESGIGEAARQLLRGISAAGIPHTTLTYTNAVSRQNHPFADVASRDGAYEVNIICINADQLPIFVKQMGSEVIAGRYSIGVWFWEAPVFPRSMHAAFEFVDEVWVASQYVADAVAAETEKPVRVMPLPVSVPDVSSISRKDVGLPDGFVFLFSFDFLSVFERKNPLGLIEAFRSAFEPGEGPTLVIKCINGDREPALLRRLREASAGRSDIRIVDRYVSAERNSGLMALCDCYVSLHRSEGFGLTMAEAMAYGRPVIATAHGGNTTFMNDENSFLVSYDLTAIPSEARPYPTNGQWAEPDVDRAGELMRYVYEHPLEAAEVGRRGQLSLSTQHTPQNAGEFVARRLQEIRAGRRPAGAHGLAPSPWEAADAQTKAELAAGQGPGGDFFGPTRRRFVTFLRGLLRRGLWPFLVHQDEVDRALVAALAELSDEQRRHSYRLEEEAAERRAEKQAMEDRLDRLMADLRAIPYVAHPEVIHLDADDGSGALGYVGGGAEHSRNAIYRGFEDIFRGDEDFIRARQSYYVSVIQGHHPVLDVGSGRGEFLDLMRDLAIPARGIDLLPEMVEYARSKGHDVEQAEANEYLASLPDGSLGAIFSAQVIEHMNSRQLLEFLALTERKLEPGGLLVAETVNMHSLAAAKNFWVDPTHVTPIFPEVAVALARLHHFWAAKVVFPNGTGEIERDLYEQGEYALIAEKAR